MRLDTKEKSAFARSCSLSGGNGSCVDAPRAFTLVELIVVISIITLLMSISLPVFSKVRQNARWIINMNNQREIVIAVNQFACNNDNSYPDSAATVTYGSEWDWQAPLMMTAIEVRPNKLHRSMSSYLFDYIDNADVLFCPDAPRKDESLQQAWEAGDEWYNPLTNHVCDHFFGTYCFYWNYIGYLGKRQPPFRGPRGLYTSGNESTLLVSCYLGYDYYRSPEAFVSCEKFDGAKVSLGTEVSSDLWSLGGPDESIDMDSMKIKLHGGYVDGHVESYCPSDTVQLEVAGDKDGSCAYDNGYGGPGAFYIPEKALPQRNYR